MPLVSCPKCGHSMNFDSKYEGKRAKCSGCQTLYTIEFSSNSVPAKIEQPNSATPQINERAAELLRQRQSESEQVRRWTIRGAIALGALLLITIGIYGISAAFKDTWEQDNKDRILKLQQEAELLSKANNQLLAYKKYQEIVSLAKDRSIDQIRHKALREAAAHAIAESKRIYPLVAEQLDQNGHKEIVLQKEIQKSLSDDRQYAPTPEAETLAKERADLEAERKKLEEERIRLTESHATKGKLRFTATYFYNDFKGNVPGEAAIIAIPKGKDLQGKRIPGEFYSMLKVQEGEVRTFLRDLGGDIAFAGGDGKAELRLDPGEYKLIVLMDVRPYFQSDMVRKVLEDWFTPKFAESQAILGRFGTKDVEIFPNDTTEASLNLK